MNLLKRSLVLSLCAALVLSVPATLVGQAASPSRANPAPQRPKLVVVVVIDQFRTDFLDRFRNRFGPGGFNRLMREGAYFSECFYPYAITETGPGHATLATGTTPDRHGIASNDWYDFRHKKLVEAAEDASTRIVGGIADRVGASPRNLLGTTVAAELRLATDGKAKVYGVALKDRAAMFSTGPLTRRRVSAASPLSSISTSSTRGMVSVTRRMSSSAEAASKTFAISSPSLSRRFFWTSPCGLTDSGVPGSIST